MNKWKCLRNNNNSQCSPQDYTWNVSFNKTIDGFGEHHFLGVDKSQCPPYEKSLIV